jgi:hypothetical protein
VNHLDDELLADIALGMDPTGVDDDPQLGEHLFGCVRCRARVESLRRTRSLLDSGSADIEWLQPPPSVLTAIQQEISADRPGPGRLVAVPIGDTSEQGTPARLRWRTPGWALAAAAAGVGIGLLAGRALWNESQPTPPPVAVAFLSTVDGGTRLGEADLLRQGGGLLLQVSAADLTPGGGYLEVWLLNRDGRRMVSLGVLDGSGPRSFPVSQELIDRGYVVVDISREGFDEQPQHSGVSLARGTLPA